MPTYPIDEAEGILEEVSDGFLRSMQRNLTATQFFDEINVEDPGIKRWTWRELEDLDGIGMSMEVPGMEGSDAGVVTEQNVEIPMIYRDVQYDGRDILAYQRSELFPEEDGRQAGRLFSEAVNDLLYVGGAASSQAVPGPSTGLLNDPDIQTYDNSSNTNWENRTEAYNDMIDAANRLMDWSINDSSLEGGMEPPFQPLLDPSDQDLFFQLNSSTDRSLAEILQNTGLFREPVFDPVVGDEIGSNEMFLFKPDPEVAAAVTPFGLNSVERFVQGDLDRETLMTGEGLGVRWSNFLAPVVRRPNGVIQVTFDRS